MVRNVSRLLQWDGGGRVVRMHITEGFTIIYILHINLELSSARIISVRAPTTWMEKEMKRKKGDERKY